MKKNKKNKNHSQAHSHYTKSYKSWQPQPQEINVSKFFAEVEKEYQKRELAIALKVLKMQGIEFEQITEIPLDEIEFGCGGES